MNESTDLITLIKTRRTIHRYLDQQVAPEIVSEAIAAAHQAPNHKFTWPWRFTVVGPETKAMIDAAALAMKSTNGPLEGRSLQVFKEKRVHPGLVVVSQVRVDDEFQAKEDYAAVSCAVQNFCLAMRAHGIGTKWSTGSLIRNPRAYDLLQIDDRAEEIVGFLWYGYPSSTPDVTRPDVSVVRRDLP